MFALEQTSEMNGMKVTTRVEAPTRGEAEAMLAKQVSPKDTIDEINADRIRAMIADVKFTRSAAGVITASSLKPGPVKPRCRCCFIGCDREAAFWIQGPVRAVDDYTLACADHIGELADEGSVGIYLLSKDGRADRAVNVYDDDRGNDFSDAERGRPPAAMTSEPQPDTCRVVEACPK